MFKGDFKRSRKCVLRFAHYCLICQLKLVDKIIELQHEISNNVVCATSKASDQPAQSHSLIRAFPSPLNIFYEC